MPTFFARLIIIVIVLLLLILLRKFLRRVVFIVILLAVAFFMYGLFSPSGASKLWYSVKNFPQRVASYLGGEAYHSYDEVANEVVQEVPEISTPKEPEQLAKSSETPAKEMQISKNFKKLTVSWKSPRLFQSVPVATTGSKTSSSPVIEGEMIERETWAVPLENSTGNAENRLDVEEMTGDVFIELDESSESLSPSEPLTPSTSKGDSSSSEGDLTPEEVRETERLFEMLGY